MLDNLTEAIAALKETTADAAKIWVVDDYPHFGIAKSCNDCVDKHYVASREPSNEFLEAEAYSFVCEAYASIAGYCDEASSEHANSGNVYNAAYVARFAVVVAWRYFTAIGKLPAIAQTVTDVTAAAAKLSAAANPITDDIKDLALKITDELCIVENGVVGDWQRLGTTLGNDSPLVDAYHIMVMVCGAAIYACTSISVSIDVYAGC